MKLHAKSYEYVRAMQQTLAGIAKTIGERLIKSNSIKYKKEPKFKKRIRVARSLTTSVAQAHMYVMYMTCTAYNIADFTVQN